MGVVDRSHLASRIALSGRTNRFLARLLAIPAQARDIAFAAALVVVVINLAVTAAPPESLADSVLLVMAAAAVAVRRR